jgi:drug/metabolite transporter (DMT)-like permease
MPVMVSFGPVVALLFNAAVWGCAWWPLRILQGMGLHPVWATTLVYLAPVAGLLALRSSPAPQQVLRSRGWLLLMAAGVYSAASNWAVVEGPVLRAVLLIYLMPVWTLLLAAWLLREAVGVASFLRILASFSGAAVILVPGSAAWTWPHGMADGLAIIAGFAGALCTVLVRRDGRVGNGGDMALMMLCGPLLTCACLSLTLSLGTRVPWPTSIPALGWAVLIILGTLIYLANAAFHFGARHLPTNITSVILLAEVLFAAISTSALGEGTPTARTLVGAGLIVSAAAWATADRRTG